MRARERERREPLPLSTTSISPLIVTTPPPRPGPKATNDTAGASISASTGPGTAWPGLVWPGLSCAPLALRRPRQPHPDVLAQVTRPAMDSPAAFCYCIRTLSRALSLPLPCAGLPPLHFPPLDKHNARGCLLHTCCDPIPHASQALCTPLSPWLGLGEGRARRRGQARARHGKVPDSQPGQARPAL